MGGSYQQEVDLLSLFKDVASDYVQMVTVPEQLPNVLDRAIRTALAERAPTALIIPADVQELEYSAPTHAFKMVPSSLGRRLADGDPRRRRACGGPPRCSTPAARSPCWSGPARAARARSSSEVADLLGAGVAKALLGKDVLSDELPYVTGSIGLLGTRPSYEMMMGLRHPAHRRIELPLHPVHARVRPGPRGADRHRRQVDRHALPVRGQPGRRRRHHPARADPAAGAQGRPVVARDDRVNVARWWETMAMEADGRRRPDQPDAAVRRAVAAAARRRDRDRRLRLVRQLVRPAAAVPRRHARLAVGQPGHHGPGVPYGIGAKFGYPDRPVIVFAGDGAMQMNGMAELITIKHYWQQWDDPRLVVAVLHNNDLNQVTWEMRAMAGAPKFAESQTLPDVDYAGFAASLGLQRDRRRRARRLGRRWDRALAADRPTVLDVHTTRTCRRSRRTPPSSRCKDAATAMLDGDEDRWGILKEGIKTKAQEFLPHRTAEHPMPDESVLHGVEVTPPRTPSPPTRPRATAP